jgi:RHS repeat-associated protein
MPHAHYEYGPFGEPIRVSGPAAALNPFRFSTKRTDNTTDLVLYEYRVCSPILGRWLSRDPIDEGGFRSLFEPPRLLRSELNLYCFLGSAPLNSLDVGGLGKPPGDGRPPGFGKGGKWKQNPDGTFEDPKGHMWRWHDGDRDPCGKRHKDHWDVTDKKGNRTRRDPVDGSDMGDAVDHARNEVENRCRKCVEGAVVVGGVAITGYLVYKIIKTGGGIILILIPEPSTTAVGCCLVFTP